MILELEKVRKSYGDIVALDGISFGAGCDEVVAVLGPNGAGKTTAIEIALGLRSADSGTVRLFGESPRVAANRRRLAAMPQESGFPDVLKVREIVGFAAAHYCRANSVEATLETFGLADLANRQAGQLSGGESRKLALALAFVGNPELVVLDEPTTGLDAQSRRRLWDEVRKASRGRTILFSTHYLEEAQALATRIVVIDRGRIIFDGNPDELRARFGVRRLSYDGTDGRVVVMTGDPDEYVRSMVTGGVAFSGLEIERPSLEEAFLSITGAAR